jgi:hypothetical protein
MRCERGSVQPQRHFPLCHVPPSCTQHCAGVEHVTCLHVPFSHVPPLSVHWHCGVVQHAPQSSVPPHPFEIAPHCVPHVDAVAGWHASTSTLMLRDAVSPFACAVIVTGNVPMAASFVAQKPTLTLSPTAAGTDENFTERPYGSGPVENVTGPALPCVEMKIPEL